MDVGMVVRTEPWDSKFTKRLRKYMAFSGKPIAFNRSLLSCFIRESKLAKHER